MLWVCDGFEQLAKFEFPSGFKVYQSINQYLSGGMWLLWFGPDTVQEICNEPLRGSETLVGLYSHSHSLPALQ